jgi:hypothetical protein
MKPIETYYNGILFRSRLEARWSYFFDCLDIQHFYEHEGFEINTGTKFVKYLPDFYIPKQSGRISVCREMFFEIKPTRDLTTNEDEKLDAFSNALSGKDAAFGILREMPRGGFIGNDLMTFEHFLDYGPDGCRDSFYQLCLCPYCWALGWEFEGKWDRIKCSCGEARRNLTPSRESLDLVKKILNTSCQAAVSQRFGN